MTRKSRNGQSMFELLVAVSIASIILIGIISLASTSVRNSTSSKDNSAASRYAQEAIEFIRGQRDAAFETDAITGWETFVTDHSSTIGKKYCLDTSPPGWTNEDSSCGVNDTIEGNTIYRRDVLLRTRDVVGTADAVDIWVTVVWDTAQGENYATVSSTLTDWRKER